MIPIRNNIVASVFTNATIARRIEIIIAAGMNAEAPSILEPISIPIMTIAISVVNRLAEDVAELKTPVKKLLRISTVVLLHSKVYMYITY
jgi:hypothetical protein